MRLSDVEIVRLLPAWMREDDAVQGLAQGSDAVTRSLAARAKLLSRWDHIDEMGGAELDEMAWELNVPWYSSAAPLAVKRALIRHSDTVHSRLGTRWAVEQIVTDYFGSGRVREWHEYGGKPQHFKVMSDNPSLTNENLSLFLSVLETVKRKSAQLDSVQISLTGQMEVYAGMAARVHTHETHAMGKESVNLYVGAILHEKTRETVRIGNLSEVEKWELL